MPTTEQLRAKIRLDKQKAQRASARQRSINTDRRRLDELVERVVRQAPALTDDQRRKLSALLAPGGGDAA